MPSSSERERVVLLTGGGGFVGTAVRALLAERARSRALVVHSPSNVDGFDLTDRRSVEDVVAAVRPDAVIHLAAVAAPREASSDPRRAWDVNVKGTMDLALAVMQSAPDARFIHVGSSEAYGAAFARSSAPVREDAPLQPVNTYGATKAAADILVGQLSHEGLRAIRFRPFNHTGPGQSETYVVPNFARQVASIIVNGAEPVIRVGNLEACRDFLDVRDVARAYVDAALGTQEIRPGLVFNLSTGIARPIRALLDELIRASGRPIAIEPDPARMRPNDLPVAAGDSSAVGQFLGWRPKISIETTLADILAEWKQRVALPQSASAEPI